MTPETDNAIRAACRRCTEEIQQAMRKKPKPNWNETVPPIINKHHKKIEALGVSLLEFVVYLLHAGVDKAGGDICTGNRPAPLQHH